MSPLSDKCKKSTGSQQFQDDLPEVSNFSKLKVHIMQACMALLTDIHCLARKEYQPSKSRNCY